MAKGERARGRCCCRILRAGGKPEFLLAAQQQASRASSLLQIRLLQFIRRNTPRPLANSLRIRVRCACPTAATATSVNASRCASGRWRQRRLWHALMA